MVKQKKEDGNKLGLSETLGLIGGMLPGVDAVATGVARGTVQRLIGFWALWHMYGSIEALISTGTMSSSSVYRQRGEFEDVFGVDVSLWAPDLASAIRESVRTSGGIK